MKQGSFIVEMCVDKDSAMYIVRLAANGQICKICSNYSDFCMYVSLLENKLVSKDVSKNGKA